jgi:hypothetical protein
LGATVTDRDPGDWVQKTAFVMPVLPAALGVDPILAALLHCLSFLDLSEDEAVDPDCAVEAMEHAAAYLQRLAPGDAARAKTQLAAASDWARTQGSDERLTQFLDRFLDDCGVSGDQSSR